MIKKIKGKFELYSKDGTKHLGSFGTKEEAQARKDEINKIKHINTMMDRRIEHMEQFVKYDYNAIANKNLMLHKEYNKVYQSIAIRISRQYEGLYHYNYERMQLERKKLHNEFKIVYRFINRKRTQ